MMRVAKRGNLILPVRVEENSPKKIREGQPQYEASGWVTDGLLIAGYGDTIEEAVDDLGSNLPTGLA